MKREQLIAFANKKYDEIDKEYGHTRLNYCQAWIVEDENYSILKSYNTVVAIKKKWTGTVFVFDYYSATTSQHIGKFTRLGNVNRVTYLYRRSDRMVEVDYFDSTPHVWKLDKKNFNMLVECDYTQVIGTYWPY